MVNSGASDSALAFGRTPSSITVADSMAGAVTVAETEAVVGVRALRYRIPTPRTPDARRRNPVSATVSESVSRVSHLAPPDTRRGTPAARFRTPGPRPRTPDSKRPTPDPGRPCSRPPRTVHRHRRIHRA